MAANEALFWTTKLIAFATLLQTLEYFQIRKSFSETGVWQWRSLSPELKGLGFYLRTPNFEFVLGLRLIAAVITLFSIHWSLLLILLATTHLIALRWRGAFNGGSDYMTFLILLAAFVGWIAPSLQTAALLYISAQTVLSYFLPGVIKLKKSEWRSGIALIRLFQVQPYGVPARYSQLANHPVLCRFAAWAVIVFECTFPLAVLKPWSCLVYLSVALSFHFANYKVFGLNRFVFAWISAYPAVLFCSSFLSSL